MTRCCISKRKSTRLTAVVAALASLLLACQSLVGPTPPGEEPGLPELTPSETRGATATVASGSPAAAPPAGSVRATVTGVIDGDTIDVTIDGQEVRVRYIGIDTPERGRNFYEEATQANATLVAGQSVFLVRDVSETDRYGRLLRYVYLEDGTFVNAELVRQGFAQASTFPPDVAHAEEFAALQAEARETGVGLWAATQAPAGTGLVILDLDVQAEWVDLQNGGGQAQDLAGWVLVSERGNQRCPLNGVLEPGETLRVYTLADDVGQGGYNCGKGEPIWSNSEPDPAVLLDSQGAEVDRFP